MSSCDRLWAAATITFRYMRMEKKAKIYVAGHQGLVGQAILRQLMVQGFQNLIYRSFSELDLRNQGAVNAFFKQERPEYVFLAAAKVGGIYANMTHPAEFIHDNLMIQTNVLHQAYASQVKRLMFLGSSCIYPKHCPQPMKEEYLLTGKLEPTNDAYAVAKIAGITMCQAYNRQYNTEFIPVMPTNLYGPWDNFNPYDSHVIPALIRRFQEGKIKKVKEAVVWGTGMARREFLYVDDLANACLFLMENYPEKELINIGVGQDLTIKELANMAAKVVGFRGRIVFDASYPEGTARKLLDTSRLSQLGWRPQTTLEEGLRRTYEWFIKSHWAGQ
jgi:GDP-L-fucose synthase